MSHSLLTLPYLILACILWVLPRSSSSKWCLKLSPVFTIYGGILLLVQYSFAFKWNSVDKHQAMKYLGIRINDFQPQFFELLAQVQLFKTNVHYSFQYISGSLYDVFCNNISTTQKEKWSCSFRRRSR